MHLWDVNLQPLGKAMLSRMLDWGALKPTCAPLPSSSHTSLQGWGVGGGVQHTPEPGRPAVLTPGL